MTNYNIIAITPRFCNCTTCERRIIIITHTISTDSLCMDETLTHKTAQISWMRLFRTWSRNTIRPHLPMYTQPIAYRTLHAKNKQIQTNKCSWGFIIHAWVFYQLGNLCNCSYISILYIVLQGTMTSPGFLYIARLEMELEKWCPTVLYGRTRVILFRSPSL